MTTPIPPNSDVMAGGLVTSTATFANAAGVAADPDTVTVKYQTTRGGPVTTKVYPDPAITKVSTGVYVVHVDTTGGSGPSVAEWIGTGAVQAIGTGPWNTVPAPL